MAARLRLKHQDEVRAKIQTSQLINRLQDHTAGKCNMSQTQVRAAEILLKKAMPDLSAVDATVAGDPDQPITVRYVIEDERKK